MAVANLATVRREVFDHVASSLERLGVPASALPDRQPPIDADRDRVPARELVDLWERAVAQAGDTCLGVRWPGRSHDGTSACSATWC